MRGSALLGTITAEMLTDISVLAGVALAVAALVLRAAHRNRHVRNRLLVSTLALAIYVLVSAAVALGVVPAGLDDPVRLARPLLLAFAVVNAGVALSINPWRHDSLPDRFPTIVQDSLVLVLFAVAASVVLQERIFATTAVGAVVVGFALQDTLGNLFAGLAIQLERPFRVGHWVRVAGTDAQVNEITWRATKLRTKAGNFLVVPNSLVARDTVLNYSEPAIETRLEIDIGASYDVPPNRVKAVILAAIRDEPLISTAKTPEVLVADFAASAVLYRVRLWTTDFGADEILRDRVRTAVYYAFGRAGIVIPYPMQVQIEKEETPPVLPAVDDTARVLAQVPIFAALSEAQRTDLARVARFGLYAAHDAVVRQGDAGASMFVVVRGEVVVTLAGVSGEVARMGAGGFFGEMSLLTGDARNATVRTSGDTELLEITADDFRRFVLENPAAVEIVGVAAAKRRAELAQHAASASAVVIEAPQGLLERMRRFLRLTLD